MAGTVQRHISTVGIRQGVGRTFASLSEINYRYLWIGLLFSTASMQMNIVARSWLAFDLTDSAFMLGVVAIARGVPQLLLAPIGGVAADRFDKRRMLIASQALLAVFSLINAVLVHMGIIQVWHLIVLSLLQGGLQPFNMPARTAVIPDLVKSENVANALALDSTGRNINRITSPAIAGILIAFEPTLAFYAIALGYVLSTFTLLYVPKGLRGGTSSRGAFSEMSEGFSYIWQHRGLFGLMAAAFGLTMLGMPFQQLLPVFQENVLNVDARGLGFMFTAVGVGAIIGSLLAAYLADRPDLGRLQLMSGLMFGVVLCGFALSTNFHLSLVLLAGIGFASQSYLTINRVAIIEQTERQLFGRVMSIYMMTWALVPAATLPIGWIADRSGVGITIFFCGVGLTLFLGGLAMRYPGIFFDNRESLAPAKTGAD